MGQVIRVDFTQKRQGNTGQLAILLEIQNLRDKVTRIYASIPTKVTVQERENAALCIANTYKEIYRLEQFLK